MHTLKIIAAGFLLLALCLLAGRWFGGPTPAAARVFLWRVSRG